MKKRLIALILSVLLLTMPLLSSADGEWTCPNCGQTGNNGNFCSNCATARPSEDWTCPNCGQEGNTGKFCSNCATPHPDGSKPAPETAPQAAVNENLEQIPLR